MIFGTDLRTSPLLSARYATVTCCFITGCATENRQGDTNDTAYADDTSDADTADEQVTK